LEQDIPYYIISILGGAVNGCNVGVEVFGERCWDEVGKEFE
jgi:hypothetical protein